MAKATAEKSGRGYWGKILHVNLTEGSFTYEEVDDDTYRKYLSGVGLGARVLWDRMKAGADPLGPDNILGFVTGVLTDTPSLFSGRFTVIGKSPATGGWGDANCGGYFAPSLKRCGVDAVFFSGISPKPVYLYLDEETARLEDAKDLWGKDAVETEEALKAKHGKRVQSAVIGQAGENKSFMAGVVNDGGRIAARAGLGGVMGAKNLKAVVAAGKKRVGVMDRESMTDLTKAYRARLDRFRFAERFLSDFVLGFTGWITRVLPVYPRQPADLWRMLLRRFGTPALTAMSAESGDSPIKNWAGVGCKDFPLSQSQKIGAESVIRFQQKKYGCFSCPLQCGGIMKIDKGPYPIEECHKPEYESICALGSLILNKDLFTLFKLNDMCNRAGIDTISCGGTVAFAVECFENGILTTGDTDGIQLRWGDGEAAIRLVEKIVKREGIGDILADGVKVAAERIGKGSEKFAVHVGGMEPPMHDPKFDPGYGIGYFFNPSPGRHTIASLTYLDLQMLEKKFSRAAKPGLFSTNKTKYRYDDKAQGIAVGTFYKMLLDASGLCLFGSQAGGDMPVCEWLNAATGFAMTQDEYLQVGERIEQLRHAFNVREGINEKRDFKPHPRLYGEQPLTQGPLAGIRLDIETLGRTYYDFLAWDPATGMPEAAHMESLGLSDVAKALGKKKKK